MKKFCWPLQRLLDIKEKQEDYARIQLVTITEQIVIIRGQIMMQKTLLRTLFNELNQLDRQQRTQRQHECMEYAHVIDEKISMLSGNLEQTEQKRKKKIEEVVTLRKLRKSLEQLRAKTLADYHEQIKKAEQKQLDENITTTYARKMLTPA